MMDTSLLQLRLSSLIKRTADLQYRLLAWKVEHDDDADAVLKDVKELAGYMDDVVEAAANLGGSDG